MPDPELLFLGLHDESLTSEERAAIPRLLGAAALAEAAPRQSGYAVRAAAMNTAGDIVRGGNRDYALSASYVHAEEAVVSKLLSEYHPGVPLLGIGIHGPHDAAGDTYTMPHPCGNCRDVLREEATPNLLLVAGDHRGAIVTRLSTFLCDTLSDANSETVLADPLLAEGYNAARRARDRSVTAYLPERLRPKVYGAALIDTAGTIFPGSLDTTISYDAIPPGIAAIQSFRNRPVGASTEVARLQAVVVVGSERFVDPLYRDRNAIAELDGMLQAADEVFAPTPVYLFGTASEHDTSPTLQVTDMLQWLPFPFTSAELGHADLAQVKHTQLQRYM